MEDQNEKKQLFDAIIKKQSISTYFQPIVNLKTSEIIGYEALSRGPENTCFYSPMSLIEMAHQEHCTWELEMIFRKKALERVFEMEQDKLVFINVDPEVIKSSSFKSGMTKEHLESIGAHKATIVFEITERTAITDYHAFQCVLENYRKQGYKIAIDDVGAGYSGLKTINEVRPEYIKMDMDLIRNIHKDTFKQALIKAFVETAITTNIKVIAEGIETKEELKTLIRLGVHAGQGFFLQKPALLLSPLEPDVVKKILDYNDQSNNLNAYSPDYHYIHNLVSCKKSTVYESMTPAITVKTHMDATNAQCVCICEHSKPVGIVTKHNIDASFSGKYGFAVFANRPVSKIMNAMPLIVDYYTPINVVAKSAMERSDDELYDDVVVIKGDEFYGLVSMKRIIEYTLMYEKNAAKELNPLTGLPGNAIINRVLSDAVGISKNTLISYLDINDFKIYNDVYGFEKGDQMIQFVAKMLKDIVKERFPYNSFIGHIGGDDFICVVDGEEGAFTDLAQSLITYFDEHVKGFFAQMHLDASQIVSEDRYGVVRAFPLTSLSVAGLYGNLSAYNTAEQLSESLAKLKTKVKKRGGSHYEILSI